MRERFWSTAELVLRKFNIGKEPSEAYNFTRSEQLLTKWHAWAAEQAWLPLGIRVVSSLHSLRVSAATWARVSSLANGALAMMKWADAQPSGLATAGEARKGLVVLGLASASSAMRPATLADFGKDETPRPYYPRFYEEPIHFPPQTRRERIVACIINAVVQWVCRNPR